MAKPPPKRRRRPVVPIEDGEWVRISWRRQREMCCACHLVHDIDYRVVEGGLQFRAAVNKRATAAARRTLKFTKDE
jgi:hypothetical protein